MEAVNFERLLREDPCRLYTVRAFFCRIQQRPGSGTEGRGKNTTESRPSSGELPVQCRVWTVEDETVDIKLHKRDLESDK